VTQYAGACTGRPVRTLTRNGMRSPVANCDHRTAYGLWASSRLVPRWGTFLCGAHGGFRHTALLSVSWILTTNSLMRTPADYEIVDGLFYPKSWLEIVLSPSLTYRLSHTVVGFYITTSFVRRRCGLPELAVRCRYPARVLFLCFQCAFRLCCVHFLQMQTLLLEMPRWRCEVFISVPRRSFQCACGRAVRPAHRRSLEPLTGLSGHLVETLLVAAVFSIRLMCAGHSLR
jgi:Cytochrome bd terminal oxidase subunit I